MAIMIDPRTGQQIPVGGSLPIGAVNPFTAGPPIHPMMLPPVQAPVQAPVPMPPVAVPAPVAAPVAPPMQGGNHYAPEGLLNMLQRIQTMFPDRFAQLMQSPLASRFGITPDNLGTMQSRQDMRQAGGFGHFGGFGPPPQAPQAPPVGGGGGLGGLSGWFSGGHPAPGGPNTQFPLNPNATGHTGFAM